MICVSSSDLRAAALLVLLVSISGCAPPRSGQQAEPAAASSAASEPAIPGRDEYEKAKQAVMVGDTRRAKELLEQATKLGPEICEYWYQLGAAESNLAIEIVNQSESEAVRVFGDAVDHKREALRLMSLGQCRIWTDDEREQARADGQAGLAESEAVLSDPVSLVAALKMYAAQRGL
jgi:hypothetical protein